MKKIAGIDYSINHPAVCINDNGEFHFYCFAEKLSKKNLFTEGYTLKKLEKCGDNIVDASLIAKDIVKILKNHGITICNLEGYSYMSSSKSLFQIAENTGILKHFLIQAGIKINIIPPSECKKRAGSGNYRKPEMLLAFLKENLKNNTFWKNCKKYEDELFTYNQDKSMIKGIKKPFEDIIDSYWISLI